MTNQEKIEKECDALIKSYLSIWIRYSISDAEFEKHKSVNGEGYSFGYKLSLEQSILHQTGIVEIERKKVDSFNAAKLSHGILFSELANALQILETLKSRVK